MYVPPNEGTRDSHGSLATTDTVVAGVTTMYVYDRMRYWYPVVAQLLTILLGAAVCVFGVAAIPIYALQYHLKNTYIDELQIAKSWTPDTFSAMKGYLFGRFISMLGWVMLLSWFSAYWWSHRLTDSIIDTTWYYNLIGFVGSYIALPLSWIFYSHDDITYALSGGLVGFHHDNMALHLGMMVNAAIVLNIIGFIWSSIRVGTHTTDEFTFKREGFDPMKLSMKNVNLNDFSTMGVPATSICYHPDDRPPVVYQLAYYLDLKASLMPEHIGTEYMSGPNSSQYGEYVLLRDRLEPLISSRPDLVANAFKVALIRDPYGDPHTLSDYDDIVRKAKNMKHGDTFAEYLWQYVYAKHPLRPVDDPFIGPFLTVGKKTTSHFANGFKYTDEVTDEPYTWESPLAEPEIPAVPVTATTKFVVTRKSTPKVTFKDPAEALIYARDYLGANNLKQSTFRDAKVALEQGNTYTYKAFMDGMDITITPTN